MKKHLKQLLLILPLILVAGASFAAYTFVGPTGAPTTNNTDGPLDISSTNQIKTGGLAVNTFQSRTGADFKQQSTFTGLVNGGTAAGTTSTITFGTTANKTSVSNIGNTAIVGSFQSDSLKTGGGSKPLCADANGVFYICGAGSGAPTNINPIYMRVAAILSETGETLYGVTLSEPTNAPVTATLSAVASNGGVNPLAYLKNMYTANARAAGVCYYTSSPTAVGTVTVLGSSTTSDDLNLPSGCDATNTYVYISSYSPTKTMGGRPIVAE